MNFALSKFHGYTNDVLEDMIPWEREVYVALVAQWVEEENQKIKEKQGQSF